MNDPLEKNGKKITVIAPPNSDPTVPGAVLSVEIGLDEEVDWVWTHFENGKSAVTGYIINKEK
jgi:hypothetical protein